MCVPHSTNLSLGTYIVKDSNCATIPLLIRFRSINVVSAFIIALFIVRSFSDDSNGFFF